MIPGDRGALPGFFESASGSAAYQQSDSYSDFTSESSITVQVRGGDANEAGLLVTQGGSPLDWSMTVSQDPAVVDYQVEMLYDVVPDGTCPEVWGNAVSVTDVNGAKCNDHPAPAAAETILFVAYSDKSTSDITLFRSTATLQPSSGY